MNEKMLGKHLMEWRKAPGLATLEQTLEVTKFLMEFQMMLEIYRPAFGEPIGLSVQSWLDQAQWYINFHSAKESENA